VSPASGGPYLPANYAPRPANYNPGEPQIATRTAGHSVPLETTVEPVTAAPVVTGNTTVAQAMSAQESCQKQLQDYLDGLAPRKRSFTREGYDAQRKAFAKTHSVKVATELAPKAVADRAEQARQKSVRRSTRSRPMATFMPRSKRPGSGLAPNICSTPKIRPRKFPPLPNW
jgi:hypothetical protein